MSPQGSVLICLLGLLVVAANFRQAQCKSLCNTFGGCGARSMTINQPASASGRLQDDDDDDRNVEDPLDGDGEEEEEEEDRKDAGDYYDSNGQAIDKACPDDLKGAKKSVKPAIPQGPKMMRDYFDSLKGVKEFFNDYSS